MRLSKWISLLTILALLCAMLTTTVADETAVPGPEAPAGQDQDLTPIDDGLEIAVDEGGLELDELIDEALDPPALSLEDETLELDGLEDGLEGDLLEDGIEAQTDTPSANIAEGDFVIDDNGTLTRYGGYAKDVVIPDGVTAIGDSAFYGYAAMQSVVIPDSVTRIGSYAFSGCTALTDVALPNALKSLGYGAFSNCGLESITLPGSITYLGSYAFSGCARLTDIHLPANLTKLPSGLFSDCDGLTDIGFLAGVTKLSGSLFSGCDGLVNVAIPDGVTSIGVNTFGNCKKLESVTIPSGVSFIDRTAFTDSPNVVLRGEAGTYAERYAGGVGIPFNAPVVTVDEQKYYIDELSGNDRDAAIVYINRSRAFSAVQKPADLARALAWSSSDPGVVTVDQNGTVTGVSQGVATITAATADGKGKAAQIRVYVPKASDIHISSYGGPFYAGRTITISADRGTPYSYRTDVDMPLSWSSSDSAVISIESTDDRGRATLKACKPGTATITAATPDGGSASVELTVTETLTPPPTTAPTPTATPPAPPPTVVTSVKIDQDEPLILYTGEQYDLTATVLPEEIDVTPRWYSNNRRVITVDSAGVVTAVAPGWTYVKASAGGLEDRLNIVVCVPPEKVTLNKTQVTLAVGDSLTLNATILPEEAEANLFWMSSNSKVVKVTQDGKITALNTGTAKITVRTDNGKRATATITVKAAPTGVTLNKTSATLGVKEGLTLKATVKPAGAYTTLSWKSSKPEIASVSGKGVITPLKAGTAKITVSTHNGKTATATITVKAAPGKVTLNKTGTVTLAKGKTLTLKATLPANTASALRWTSSKPKIASVSQGGVVTALAKGSTVITVTTFNGKTAKVTINVK